MTNGVIPHLSARSTWLHDVLLSHPEVVPLRERLLPATGGISFSHISHTEGVDSLCCLSGRFVLLELIYQHLESIGLHQTADELRRESRHDFQRVRQPWNRTHLLLVTSLGIRPNDDPWSFSSDENVPETSDEDFFAANYTEDAAGILDEYARFVKSPKKLSEIKTASLKTLISALVFNKSNDQTLLFFLILPSITRSEHFLDHLIQLFHDAKNDSITLSIINLMKAWIEYLGGFIGKSTIKKMTRFFYKVKIAPSVVSKLLEMIANLKNEQYQCHSTAEPPDPDIKNPEALFHPDFKILDDSPKEVARQLTLKAHQAFSRVHPHEFYTAIVNSSLSLKTPSFSEYFKISQTFTLLFLDTFLNTDRKRDFYKKLFDVCIELSNINNFDTLIALLSIVSNNEVRDLASIGEDELKSEIYNLLEECGEVEEEKKYIKKITVIYREKKNAIPNMHFEITSLPDSITKDDDFIDDPNAPINWKKRNKIGEKCQILFWFQNQKYNFQPIPQIQSLLDKCNLDSKTVWDRLSAEWFKHYQNKKKS